MRTYFVTVILDGFIYFSTAVTKFPAFLVGFNMVLRKTTGNIRFVAKYHTVLFRFLNM